MNGISGQSAIHRKISRCEFVRLVDNDQIDVGSFTPRNRLDATDLDGLLSIGARMDALHTPIASMPSASKASTV